MKYILLITFLKIFVSLRNETNETYIQQFQKEIIKFLKKVSNDSLLDERDKNFTRCNSTNDTIDIGKILEYSGKSLGDIGNEKACEKIATHLLVVFYLKKHTKNETKENHIENGKESITPSYQEQVETFLNVTEEYIGICVYNDCKDFIIYGFLNNTRNSNFSSFLEKSFNISKTNQTSIFTKNETINYKRVETEEIILNEDKSKSDKSKKIALSIFFYFLFVILIIKVVAFFLHMILTFEVQSPKEEVSRKTLSSKNSKALDVGDNKIYDENEDDEEYYFNDPRNKEKAKKNNEMLKDISEGKKTWYYSVLEFFDVTKDITELTTLKSRYYNENGIEIFATLRFFIMIAMILSQMHHISIRNPGKDFSTSSFFRSPLFVFVALSQYAWTCFAVIDGGITTYKLLSFLKKQIYKSGYNRPDCKMMLTFFLNCLPKVICYLVIFFLPVYLFEQLGQSLGGGSVFNFYYNVEVWKKCLDSVTFFNKTNPFTPIFPYFDRGYGYVDCYRFTYHAINYFYSFILLLFIIYFSFFIKRQIFDYIIIMLVFTSTFTSFLCCDVDYRHFEDKITSKMNFSLLVGELYSGKKFHIFFIYYFLGAFAGSAVFYYHDIVSSNTLKNMTQYIPFSLSFEIIKGIDTISLVKKYVSFYVFIMIFLLLSSPFTIHMLTHGKDEPISFEYSFLYQVLFYSKNLIFGHFFAIFIILIYAFPAESFVSNFFKWKFTYFTNRISFFYFITIDTGIYIFTTIYNLNLRMTHLNMVTWTLGIFLVHLVICFTLMIALGLLIRIPIKKLIRKIADSLYKTKDQKKEEEEDKTILPESF